MGTNEKKRRRFLKQSFTILIGFALLVAVLLYARNLELHQSRFYLRFKNPNSQTTNEFMLEKADTEQKRNKGLMFRKSMAPDEGMIFVFDKESVHTFYMKNTYLSLDMIFVDSKWKVVGILEDVPVLNEELRSVPTASQYVIELNAGIAKRSEIAVGSEVIFEGKPPTVKTNAE